MRRVCTYSDFLVEAFFLRKPFGIFSATPSISGFTHNLSRVSPTTSAFGSIFFLADSTFVTSATTPKASMAKPFAFVKALYTVFTKFFAVSDLFF